MLLDRIHLVDNDIIGNRLGMSMTGTNPTNKFMVKHSIHSPRLQRLHIANLLKNGSANKSLVLDLGRRTHQGRHRKKVRNGSSCEKLMLSHFLEIESLLGV